MYIIQHDSSFDRPMFRVAATDKELLGELTKILKQKGFVGCWDKTGEMRFLLDGRAGGYSTVLQMEVVQERLKAFEERCVGPKDKVVQQKIMKILLRRGFSPELKGTGYLVELLFYLLQPGHQISNLSKGGYLHLAKHHGTDSKSVDRSIRYAKRKAGILLNNRSFFLELLEECRSLESESALKPVAGEQISWEEYSQFRKQYPVKPTEKLQVAESSDKQAVYDSSPV